MEDLIVSPILVVGAGSWGSALALCLSRNGNQVRLWGHNPTHMRQLQQERVNERYLPGFPFPDSVQFYTTLADALTGVTDIVLAVPSATYASILAQINAEPAVNTRRYLIVSKGIDPASQQLLSDLVLQQCGPDTAVAVLSGPSFAREVALEQPTAVSLAGNDAAWLENLVSRFHSDVFRVYINPDLVGVQLCGVMKNILAIATGVADGMGLGANPRAALITRGLAEMARLCQAMGAHAETLMSLAGIGDVVLTCTDNQSRNRLFGLALGQGQTPAHIFAEIAQEVEGAHNVRQVWALAQQYKIEMPITQQIYLLLAGEISKEAVLANLLQRDPTLE